MKNYLRADDPKAVERWAKESADEFNLTRLKPITGSGTWTCGSADGVTLETVKFNIPKPGARITFSMVARMTTGFSASAGLWTVGFEALLDSEVASTSNGAFIGHAVNNAVYAPIVLIRTTDVAPGRHTITLKSTESASMADGSMVYQYTLVGFIDTLNTPIA